MSPNLSVLALLSRNTCFLLIGANLLPRLQSLASNLAIGFHLLQNPTRAQHHDDSRYFIFAQGRFPFHLSALEATYQNF